jgi:LCP family protein required for cell wall assembly
MPIARRVRYLVILGLAWLAVGCSVRWLLSDFGVRKQESAQKPAAPQPRPSASIASIPDASQLPLEPRHSPLTGTENILIAGMDRRPLTKGSGLTDTLIVVALEQQTGRVGLISIPRDVAIQVPTLGLERINTVYSMAQARGDDALAALKRSVSELLALPLKHAVVIDLAVFEQTIDTLGGVTVGVPCPIIDDFVDPRTTNGRRILDIEAGRVRMDGATAAMYVRSRHGRSDFSRARRQQAVLNAIHRELLTLGSLGHLPTLLKTVERSVATDLKRYELLDLARRALTVNVQSVHAIVLTEKEVEPVRDRGRAMLSPNLDAIDLAVSRLFSAPAPGIERNGAVCPPADIALRRKDRSLPASSTAPSGMTASP